jgi:hypothetical protein
MKTLEKDWANYADFHDRVISALVRSAIRVIRALMFNGCHISRRDIGTSSLKD